MPPVGSGRPFAGDRWAAEHPTEFKKEEADALRRQKRALRAAKRGKEVLLGDLFAPAFTTRTTLNAADKIHRREWQREIDAD